jgi:hypothetical protein
MGGALSMTDLTPYYYALSAIAQVAAALAALIGFFGLWRLDRLRDEQSRLTQLFQMVVRPGGLRLDDLRLYGDAYYAQEVRAIVEAQQHTMERQGSRSTLAQALDRWDALPGEQRSLRRVLRDFLAWTLTVLFFALIILSGLTVAAVKPDPWFLRFLGLYLVAASFSLAVGPMFILMEMREATTLRELVPFAEVLGNFFRADIQPFAEALGRGVQRFWTGIQSWRGPTRIAGWFQCQWHRLRRNPRP